MSLSNSLRKAIHTRLQQQAQHPDREFPAMDLAHWNQTFGGPGVEAIRRTHEEVQSAFTLAPSNAYQEPAE